MASCAIPLQFICCVISTQHSLMIFDSDLEAPSHALADTDAEHEIRRLLNLSIRGLGWKITRRQLARQLAGQLRYSFLSLYYCMTSLFFTFIISSSCVELQRRPSYIMACVASWLRIFTASLRELIVFRAIFLLQTIKQLHSQHLT